MILNVYVKYKCELPYRRQNSCLRDTTHIVHTTHIINFEYLSTYMVNFLFVIMFNFPLRLIILNLKHVLFKEVNDSVMFPKMRLGGFILLKQRVVSQ